MTTIKRAPRVPFEEEVQYTSSTGSHRHRAVNISLSGIFIQAGEVQPVDTVLDMTFELPVNGVRHPLQVRGKVYRSVETAGAGAFPPGMGVTFIGLEPRTRTLLLELIRERMSGARVWSDDTPSGPFQMRDPERDLTVATPPVWERRLPFVLLAVLVGMLAYVLWYAL